MSIRELTCIGCPMGCQLTAVMDGSRVTEVTGNTCPRGDAYARKECTHPARTVTGTVRVSGGLLPVVSVRTARGAQGEGSGCGPGAVPGAADGPGAGRGRGDPRRAGHRRGRGGHPVRVTPQITG